MRRFNDEGRLNGNHLLKRLGSMVLRIVVMLYLALVIYAWFFSEKQIFLPHPASYHDNLNIIKLTSANGARITARYLPNPAARFTLLVSHGNAEDLGDDHDWLLELNHAGFNVLAFDYQGYGTSEGKPTEKGSYEDEQAAYNYLRDKLDTPADRIIIFGRSVGSGPAVWLAARKPAAALILQSPFLSAFRVLTQIPILPFDRFPNARDISKVRCPVLVMHGAADEVIPYWHGQKLFKLANEPKTFVGFPGAGHNDVEIVAGVKYFQAIRQFIDQLK
jgi:fermentation-respiration switch protein FrsA (DUF1100 family)